MPDYARLADRAESLGWAATVEEALGPGEAYRLRTADHRAAASLIALPKPGGTALDLECGMGSHAVALAAVCKEVVATDSDRNAVRLLDARVREAGIDNLHAQDDVPLHAIPPRSIHLAVARGGSIRTLPQIANLLVPGGRIAVGAANRFSFIRRRRERGLKAGLRFLKNTGDSAGLRLVEAYGAWRDVDDVSLLFALDPESLRSTARRLGLPVLPAFLRAAWVPAYWVVWEKPK